MQSSDPLLRHCRTHVAGKALWATQASTADAFASQRRDSTADYYTISWRWRPSHRPVRGTRAARRGERRALRAAGLSILQMLRLPPSEEQARVNVPPLAGPPGLEVHHVRLAVPCVDLTCSAPVPRLHLETRAAEKLPASGNLDALVPVAYRRLPCYPTFYKQFMCIHFPPETQYTREQLLAWRTVSRPAAVTTLVMLRKIETIERQATAKGGTTTYGGLPEERAYCTGCMDTHTFGVPSFVVPDGSMVCELCDSASQ